MYLTLQEVKDAVKPAGREGEEFYEKFPEPEFDALLTTFEEESRAVINGQIKGQGYEKETGRTDTFDAPDKPTIQLTYPVDTVSKVERQVRPGEWKTLDSDLYTHDDQQLKVKETFVDREYPFKNNLNPLTYYSNRATWSGVGNRIRVTYDRGFETANIPNEIKSIQKKIIRRMLVHLRQEQNLANLNPDDVQAFNTRRILTEDIKDRISTISQTKHKYVMLR